MKTCSYCDAKYPDDVLVCPTDGNPLGDPAKSQQYPLSVTSPRVRCPNCGAADDYSDAIALRSSFNWLVFLAGGIFAVMFHNASRGKKVRCNQCESVFEVHAPLSALWWVIFLLLLCPAIMVLLLWVIWLLGGNF